MFMRNAFMVLCSFQLGGLASAAQVSVKKLKAVSVNAALDTIEPSVASFLVEKEQLLVFPTGRGFFLTVPFHPQGQKKIERFETQLSQRRVSSDLKFNATRSFPLGIARGFLFFDSLENQMVHLSKAFKVISPERSVVYDLIKPAADRGGEPTWVEVQKLQGRFASNYLAHQGEKFSGISPVPGVWVQDQFRRSGRSKKSEQHTFLVLSRIHGFLLNLLTCTEESPSQCVLERACSVRGLPSDFQPRGLTLAKDMRLVFIGDDLKNRIAVLKFHSCFDVAYAELIEIPAQVKQLTDIQVDDDGRLWVSSRRPDDYFNASIFMWEAKEW